MKLKRKKHLMLTVLGFITAGVFFSCNNKSSQPVQRTFPSVTVPTIYATPQDRAEYLAIHYWDNFDFNDTAYIGSAAFLTQQALADYISILPYASYDVITQGLKQVMEKADQNPATYAFFASQMELYLFDLNSRLRNEEFFIPVLEHEVASKSLDQPRKVRPNLLLAQLQKNRPGKPATNINFMLASGAKDSLSNIKSDYTLLMFYNLDCGNCRDLTAAIESSEVIKEFKKQNKLKILAIYPGQDLEAWKKYQQEMPASWINGYDYNAEIGQKETYILRVIPTLYLLDKNHMIIMKDAAFNYVEYYLNSILNPPVANNAAISDTATSNNK